MRVKLARSLLKIYRENSPFSRGAIKRVVSQILLQNVAIVRFLRNKYRRRNRREVSD